MRFVFLTIYLKTDQFYSFNVASKRNAEEMTAFLYRRSTGWMTSRFYTSRRKQCLYLSKILLREQERKLKLDNLKRRIIRPLSVLKYVGDESRYFLRLTRDWKKLPLCFWSFWSRRLRSESLTFRPSFELELAHAEGEQLCGHELYFTSLVLIWSRLRFF